jgi:hypothetical protein
MRLAIALALLLLPAAPALAAGCDQPAEIRFAPGTSAGEVTGGAPRGDRDCWLLRAAAGQAMEARISSTESNAVFQIYAPGWRHRFADGMWQFTGTTLPGAAESQDATRWSGQLPAGGPYLIVVGATRGGTAYRLNVTVR